METGSKSSADQQTSFSISPDKEASDSTPLQSVVHITRTGISHSRFKEDRVQLVDLHAVEFPYEPIDSYWAVQVQGFRQNHNLINARYLIEPSSFVLIPETLFRKSDIPDYFSSLGHSIVSETVTTSSLQSMGLKICCSFPNKIAELFAADQLVGDVVPSIASIGNLGSPIALVLIRQEHLDVFIYDQRLKLANRYSAEDENDVLYFCIAAIEQCGLTLEETTVSVSGSERRLAQVSNLLSKYIPQIQPLEVTPKLKVPYAFKDIKAAWCWPLLNTYLCE